MYDFPFLCISKAQKDNEQLQSTNTMANLLTRTKFATFKPTFVICTRTSKQSFNTQPGSPWILNILHISAIDILVLRTWKSQLWAPREDPSSLELLSRRTREPSSTRMHKSHMPHWAQWYLASPGSSKLKVVCQTRRQVSKNLHMLHGPLLGTSRSREYWVLAPDRWHMSRSKWLMRAGRGFHVAKIPSSRCWTKIWHRLIMLGRGYWPGEEPCINVHCTKSLIWDISDGHCNEFTACWYCR